VNSFFSISFFCKKKSGFALSVQLGAARVESRAFGDHHAFSEKVSRLPAQ
jgi:hypothetical protein